MKLNLNKISIKNFKGIKSLEVTFYSTTNIHGANGTGKTSIYDAFLWLLFGKDSSERKDFEIKPLGKNGEPIHKLTTEVEATFQVNGELLTLRKTYAEKWTKRRGSTTEELTGHVTECFVNDVPCAVSEYNKRISEICSEDTFKRLTNVKTFVNLKKEVKRQILFSLIGDVAPTTCDFTDVEEWLKEKSEDAIISECKAKIKRCKDNVATIPARIEEIERSKPNALDWASIEASIAEVETEVKAIDAQIENKAQAYNALYQAQQQAVKEQIRLRAEIEKKKAEIEAEINQSLWTAQRDNEKIKGQLSALNNDSRLATLQQQRYNNSLVAKNAEKEELLAEWKKIKARQYVAIEEGVCPTCGQVLPQADIDAENARLKANFDAETQRLLDNNKATGIKVAQEINELTNLALVEVKKIADIAIAIENLPKLKEEIAPTQEEIQNAIETNEEIISLTAQLEAINVENITPPDNSELKAKRDELLKRVADLREKLYVRQYIEHSNERIKELDSMLRADNEAIADYEYKLMRLADYRKAKVELIEEQINNLFNIVTWKLFDTQLNGGEVEVCEPMVNGVPYADLNTAMKINVGLDIINTFSKVENKFFPLFIDNRESVTELAEVDSQIINLYVDPTCTTIEVR